MDEQAKAAKAAENEKKQREKDEKLDRRLEKIERKFPFMNVGNALKVTCVGFALGIILRVVQMLYSYDYDTNFYTDGGLLAWLGLALMIVIGIAAGAMCFLSRRYFGPYVPRKNNVLGIVALLSGAALLASSILQTVDYMGYLDTGLTKYDSTSRTVIHFAFIITGALFGLVQVYASVGFFTGTNNLEKAPLLYLTGSLWGISQIVLVYVFYAKASSTVENFFAVAGASATLLSLFYLCKLFAGADEAHAAKRVFVFGIFSVILNVTYTFSNLALRVLGKRYTGEMPVMLQVTTLAVALFILVFLMTFRKYSIRRTTGRGLTSEFSKLRQTKEENAEEQPAKRKEGRRFRPN